MGLPKPIRPEYSTTIPSTGKKVKYQPFTVKQEKVLILAAESQDQDEIVNAIINVLSSCITSPSDIRIEELALFDIEYLFLKARAKSVGEKIEVSITDPNDETFETLHSIYVDKIGVEKNEEHTDLVTLLEGTAVKMRYPDISFFADGIQLNNITDSIKTICRCIESVIIDDEVYNSVDMSANELEDWIEDLTSDQFKKINSFFETMPKLKHTVTIKNTNTNKDFKVTLEGLADFF